MIARLILVVAVVNLLFLVTELSLNVLGVGFTRVAVTVLQ